MLLRNAYARAFIHDELFIQETTVHSPLGRGTEYEDATELSTILLR